MDALSEPYRRFAAAILVQAVKDAKSGNDYSAEARRWLRTAGCDLAEMLDIPPERVAAFLDGLPGPPYEQLSLLDW